MSFSICVQSGTTNRWMTIPDFEKLAYKWRVDIFSNAFQVAVIAGSDVQWIAIPSKYMVSLGWGIL